MLLVSCLQIWMINTLNMFRVFIGLIIGGSLFYAWVYASFAFGMIQGGMAFWFLLKMCSLVVLQIVNSTFWSFVDEYYDLQDAKRLYGLFTSAILLGNSLGGAIIYWFVEALGIGGLFSIVTLLLAVSGGCIFLIARRVQPIHDDDQETQFSIEKTSLKSFFKTLFTSKITLLMMGGNILLQLLSVMTEFNYYATLQQTFERQGLPLEETGTQLAAFLGQCLAWVGLGNTIFGMFFFGRMVKRFGVKNIILLMPMLYLFLFSWWNVHDSLAVAVLGIIAVEGALYSVDDNIFNLVLRAAPQQIKNKVRAAVDFFFEPIGMLLSSLLMLALDSRCLALSFWASVLALAFALLLRSQYRAGIFANLKSNALHFGRSVADWLKTLSKKDLRRAEIMLMMQLRHTDDDRQLAALEAVLELGNMRLLPLLLTQVDRLNIPCKIRALELLAGSCWAKESLVLDRLQSWGHSAAHPRLKSAIYLYLARCGLLHPARAVPHLDSPNAALKAASILALKTSTASLSPSVMAEHRALANEKVQELLQSDELKNRLLAIQILGFEMDPSNIEFILPFLKTDVAALAKAAAKALTYLSNEQTVGRMAPALITTMSASEDSELRMLCLQALDSLKDVTLLRDLVRAAVHFRPQERRLVENILSHMGPCTVPTLLAIVKDASYPDRSRLIAGKVLGKLSLPQLRTHLLDILTHEIERAYFYFYYHHTVNEAHPEHDLSMLQDALLTGFHSVLDFVIQLISLAGALEDGELLSRSLRSSNPRTYAGALETLQVTCEEGLFALLEPLVGDGPLEARLQLYLSSGRTPYALDELLDKMAASSSLVDRVIAAAFEAKLETPAWKEQLRCRMRDNEEEILHHFSYELLAT